jgi:hypothetical protein
MRYRWEIRDRKNSLGMWLLDARPLNGGNASSIQAWVMRRHEPHGGMPRRPYRVSYKGASNICRAWWGPEANTRRVWRVK